MTTMTPAQEIPSVLSCEHMVQYLGTAPALDALHRSWMRLFLATGRASVTSLRYDTLFPLAGVPAFTCVVAAYDHLAACFAAVNVRKSAPVALQGALERYIAARAEAVQVLCHYERQVGHDVAVVLPYLAPRVGHLVQEWLTTAEQIPETPAALPQHVALVHSLMGTLTELQTAGRASPTQSALGIEAMLALLAKETDGGAALMQVLAQLPAPSDLVAVLGRAGSTLRTLQTHTVAGSPESALLFVTAVGDLALAYCQWGQDTATPMAGRHCAALATLALQESLFHDWLAHQDEKAVIGSFSQWPSASPLVTFLVALTGPQSWHMLDGIANAAPDGNLPGSIAAAEVVFLPAWANALHTALRVQYAVLGDSTETITVDMALIALMGGQHDH